MNDLQPAWLVATLLQVLGAALALSVIGFTYDASLREKKQFVKALQEGTPAGWLSISAVIIVIGLSFTHVGWGIKAIAIALALVLLGLAWVVGRKKRSYRAQVSRQKISGKSIAIFAAKAWLGIFLILIVVWCTHLGWHAYHLYSLAREVQNDPGQLQVESLAPLVSVAAGDIRAIHGDLRPLFPIFNAMKGLPVVGATLGQVEPLLTYANGLAQAGDEVITGLEPLLEQSAGELSLPERASQVLEAGQDHFSIAIELIEQARSARQAIRTDLLPDQLKSVFSMLDDRFDLLEAGARLLKAAPTLLGSDKAQNYLVLAQNRDELRPTGGFISGIGLVTLQEGKIQGFSLEDSYAVDDFTKSYPTPPEALKRFMLADYWVTRDANWSPDFPIAAQQAQALYTLSTGVETQGVIAFNQLAVRKILEVVGPVQVPGTDVPISADNIEEYMRQAWAPEPSEGLSQEWWLHRKDFMQQLGDVIIEKILNPGEGYQLKDLAYLLVDLLDQGQLLVYFNDNSSQAALAQAGWDGALHRGSSDYLYMVDSNVGFNKMDSVVTRSLTYRVDLSDPSQPVGEVSLSYQNTATGSVPCVQIASYGNGTYQDMQQRCYWDYWRLYTPAGSQLLSTTAQAVPPGELLNKQGWSGQVESLAGEVQTEVFAGLLVLPLSQSTQVDLAYQLPVTVLSASVAGQQEYSLSIDVQPGLQGLPFKLEVVLPPSIHVTSASEGMVASNANTWTWQGVLEKSIELTLSFTPGN